MTLSDYLSLFPGASRDRPRFMALAEAVLRQACDLMSLTGQVPSGFSFASAAGKQLDAAAAAVGLRRENGMADEDFRQYVLAKLALWTWDGTNEGVPDALGIALPGCTVTDNRNGTVTVMPVGVRRDLLPVPAGVRINETSGETGETI